MALTTISNSSTVLYGSANSDSYISSLGASYVFGSGGSDSFLDTSSYIALYSGGFQDYDFTVTIGEDGSETLFVEDLRVGSPDGIDSYQGSIGSLGFQFNPNTIAANQTIDIYSFSDLIGSSGQVDVNEGPFVANDSISLTEDQALRFDPSVNDINPDTGETSIPTEVSQSSSNKGSVVLDSEGYITFSAIESFDYLQQGESATEVFSYTGVDGNGLSDTAFVDVTIEGVNDPPAAGIDQVSVNEDADLVFNPLDNDIDLDQGDTIKVVEVSNPASNIGSALLLENNQVIYQTNGAFDSLPEGGEASETFFYQISDDQNSVDQGQVDVTINGVNDAPIAQSDTFSVFEDEEIEVDVTQNDSDVDEGDLLKVTEVLSSPGSVGEVKLDPSGSVSYSATTGFDSLAQGETTTETFEYTVSDELGVTDQADATVTVVGVNDAPVAVDDVQLIPEDHAKTFDPTLNDSDVDNGDVLTLVDAELQPGSRGEIEILPNGQILYDAKNKFNELAEGSSATESLTYTISDQVGAQSVGNVDVVIPGVNDAPVAQSDTFSVFEDEEIEVDVTQNDSDVDEGDLLKVTEVLSSPGSVGEVKLDPSGSVSYSATTGFDSLAQGETTTETFEYTVSDELGVTDQADATVTVVGVNDAPVAVDDVQLIPEDHAKTFDPTLNDSDVDNGDVLTLVDAELQPGSRGEIEILPNGQILYDAKNKFNELAEGSSATESLTYTISDQVGAQSVGNVDVVIPGVNDAPVASDDQLIVSEDQIVDDVDVRLLSNDDDVDNNAQLNVSGVVDDSSNNGALMYSADSGRVVYDPVGKFDYLNEGEEEVASFTYFVSDEFGASDDGQVDVIITGSNDAPVANQDLISISPNENYTFNPADNDTDVDLGDQLRVVSIGNSSENIGTVVLDPLTGNVTYSTGTSFDFLGRNEQASETFEYTVEDSSKATAQGTVVVTVTGKSRGPELQNDDPIIYRISEDFSSTVLDLVSEGRVVDADEGDVLRLDNIEATALSGLSFDRPADSSSLVVTKMLSEQTYQGVPIADLGYDDFDYLSEGDTLSQDIVLTFSDESGKTVDAQVTLEIQGRNDAPIRIDGDLTDLGKQPLTTPIRITQEQLLNSSFYDVEEDDLFVSDVSIVSGGGILTDAIDEVGVWEYLPEKPGDVTFEFTVSDGEASLASAASMVVVPPFLGDAVDRYAIAQSENGYWQVQEYVSNKLEVEQGDPILLNDGRGNLFDDKFLPEGYIPVAFDAVSVSGSFDSDSASQWYFNLVLRGDDPITGLSSYRTQSFAETTVNADGSRQATALRNDEPLSYADVVLLETELNQDYPDQDKWKQVDIDGDGKLGLDFEGAVLAQSGDIQLIDAGSAILLHRQQVNLDDNGQISQSPVDLENSDILTSADGSDIYSIDPFDVQAVSNINGFDQVFFAGSSSVGLEYMMQSFDDNGKAVGASYIVSSQDFEEAKRLGQLADQQQDAIVADLVQSADPLINIAVAVQDELQS